MNFPMIYSLPHSALARGGAVIMPMVRDEEVRIRRALEWCATRRH
jgi:hypothetical protein